MVLEELNHAIKRNAKIYCELIGYGLSGDAHHITSPSLDGRGAYNCMRNALKQAKLVPEDIDYINAHATGTELGDKAENEAIKRLFGSLAPKLSISSTKGSIGHLLGAAGSVEAIFTVLSIQNSIIPPTLNLENPDINQGFCLDYTAKTAKQRQIKAALSNSFGFGGTNASLVFKKFYP